MSSGRNALLMIQSVVVGSTVIVVKVVNSGNPRLDDSSAKIKQGC